ncbi:hypothetical protein HYU22_05410 [Candidatus Woesearchaeota archaeon]|nr:hypothetical protein [Candidatus Woesearchaeota archaeon]
MAKKKIAPKKAPAAKEREPEYMVQLGDPKMVRKDLLESLREIIIFMQGYEQFRKIQHEKIAVFNALKEDLKELRILLDLKLKRRLPKGKMRPALGNVPLPAAVAEEEKMEMPVEQKPAPPKPKAAPSRNDLDELEAQLRDIEGELRRV